MRGAVPLVEQVRQGPDHRRPLWDVTEAKQSKPYIFRRVIMYREWVCVIVLSLVVMAASVEADTLSGLADVTVADGAIISLRHAGTEYVVVNGDLALGTTTRWYIPADTGVPTLWVDGAPAPAATVNGTSNPKAGDMGPKADNFLFTLTGASDLSSIDGINYQETVFPFLTDTFFLFERGGNDPGTCQAILADGSLGEAIAFDKAANGGPYADTKVGVAGQNAFGLVFTTAAPVKGVRITASGFDALSVSAAKHAVTIAVDPNGDIAAANALAKAGDTIEIAAGTYYLASQIQIKDGVAYRGAGSGLTVIDGNNVTRAFVAWGDRFVNEDSDGANTSGPKGWVLEGMTIQNCVADANDRFSYMGVAFNLKTDFATLDANASGGLDPAEANGRADGIRLAGADATEGTADDDLHRFAHIDIDASGELSQAELDAQILLREDEFGDQSGDGGAFSADNGAVGTIQNCEFLNNHTPAEGNGDDGGAINITGLAVVTVNDCLFEGNYACSPDSTAIEGSDGDAGHIKIQGSSASALTPGTTLIANRCTFRNGNASDDGGAIQSSAVGNVIRLDSCWFEGNTSWDNGNVCQFSDKEQSEVTVTNCIFVKNIAKADNSPDRMIETNRNTKFVNCTFVGNHVFDEDIIYNNADAADTDGDGVNDETADVTQVVNCLFANNTFGADAGNDHVLSSRNATFSINAVNCLFFNNLKADGKTAMAVTNRTATGNVTKDPLLDANYAPGAGSPAIDAGVDPATVGVTVPADYNGVPRPQGAAFDIGAHEFGAAVPVN